MKLRKILAGVVATTVAMSTMAIASFAAVDSHEFDATELEKFQTTAEESIVIEYNSPNGWEDIGFGFSADGGWKSKNYQAEVGEGTLTISIADVMKDAGIVDPTSITYGKVEGFNDTILTSVKFASQETPGETDAPEVTEYSADLCLQTGAWTYRNALGDDLHSQLTKWVGDVAVDCGAKFTDATVDKDGTYTVSVTGYDFAADSTEPLNLLFISTNIPLIDTITWTVDEVNLVSADGTKTALAGATGIQDKETKDFINMHIQNKWNEDVTALEYTNPTSGFEVTFTINGLESIPAETTPVETTAEETDETTAEETTAEETTAEETTAPEEEDTTAPDTDLGDSEEVPGDSSGNNNNGGNDDTNENTGIALVVIPAIIAGAAATVGGVSLKRKNK